MTLFIGEEIFAQNPGEVLNYRIYSPTHFDVFDVGEPIFIHADKEGEGEREIIVYLHAVLAGEGTFLDFKQYASEQILQSWHVQADSDCKNEVTLLKTYKDPTCSRRGQFRFRAKFKNRKSWIFCNTEWDDTNMPTVSFTVGLNEDALDVENVEIPDPNIHLPCPGEEYTLSFSTKQNYTGDAQWYKGKLDGFQPDIIDWVETRDYSTINGLSYVEKGPEYKTTYGALDTYYVFSHQIRDAHECKVADFAPSQVDVLFGIDAPFIPAPLPQYKAFCEKGTYTITVPPSFLPVIGELDVAWYRPNENIPFHYGATLTKHFENVSEMFEVEYYKEGDCEVKSLKSAIHVTVLPQASGPDGLFPNNSIENHTIYDHRDAQQECFDNSSFYHDLNDGNNLNSITSELTDLLTLIQDEVSGASPFVTLKFTNVGELYWENRFGEKNYYEIGDEARVCSDNITSNQGSYNWELYYLNANVTYVFETTKEDGTVVTTSVQQCEIKGIRKKRISNIKPGTNSPTDNCVPPAEQLVNTLLGNEPFNGLDCETSEVVRVCPNSGDVIIGPSPGLDLPGIDFYEWSPGAGLSDPSIKNPIISYSSVPLEDYQIMRYNLIYGSPTLLGSDRRHCTVVYKCKSCGPPEDDVVIENPLGN
ncbi:MAG: hypothetical protein ACI9YL_001539 [Luteibaculaceae bacterium]|jgi:hypothetical protein